jgi:hypothetical protein
MDHPAMKTLVVDDERSRVAFYETSWKRLPTSKSSEKQRTASKRCN